MLIAIAIASVGFALCAAVISRQRERSQVADSLRSMGAYYTAFNDGGAVDWVSFRGRVNLDGIARHDTIEVADFAKSRVRDGDLRQLALLPKLRLLDLSGTQISDDGMRFLSGMQSLEILRLNDSAVTDKGMESIAAAPALKAVDISGTHVTRAGVERLKSLRPELTVRF